MNIHEYTNWLLLIYDSLWCRNIKATVINLFNILHHSNFVRCNFFFFFQIFGNKIRPFNIHKYANEVICIFELHLKEQSLRFILVSVLMFYDKPDLSYKQITV